MLKTRVITAVVLLTVLILVLAFGDPLAWNLFVLVTLVAAFWEWMRLGGKHGNLVLLLAIVSGGCFILLYYLLDFSSQAVYVLSFASIFWLVLGPWCLHKASIGLFSNPVLYNSIGFVLIGAAGLALNLAQRHGIVFLLSVVAICWVADIFAYIFGKWLGKRKLAPRISPGKSWEGALGGTFSVVLISWLLVFSTEYFPVLNDSWQVQALHHLGAFGFTAWLLVLSAYSIVGDLFESLLKRTAGMKDSSQLLPGHGGVLDRIDAQLPVLPLAMIIFGAGGF